ncbi:DUF6049 family protein [Rathayibacter soli]|uniref:DUF6049 family protein n=1 Tax=Rathayibacter soli TaxID=3144168 RepID=UPI0027E3B5C8|nr:DUF6049 family protein [Glaciibacter superstes]
MRIISKLRVPHSRFAPHTPLRAVLALIAAMMIALPTMAVSYAPVPHAVSKQSATVSVYGGNSGVLTPGENLTATVVVTNTGSETLNPGTIALQLTTAAFAERFELNAWLKHADDAPSTRAIGTTPTTALAAGTSTTVSLTVASAELGIARQTTGVYGLAAALTINNAAIASGAGSIVWNTGTGFNQSGVAVAMPITAPATSAGLIPAADLATYTAANGVLSRELNGVLDQPAAAIGIDPMIIASIRVLGTAAPASAQAWLRELEQARNDIFPLQYGDADVAGQVQAGVTDLLQPIAFTYAMDPNNQKVPLVVGETGQPTAPDSTPTTLSPTPTPTPTPTTGPALPSMSELLAWPYTLSDIAWPPDNSVRTSDLPVFAKNGLTTTILDGGNTNAGSLSHTPNPALPVSGGRALVADDAVSDALRAAATAATESAWRTAMAGLNAQLAMIGTEQAPDQMIFATLDRTAPVSSQTLSQTFGALSAMPWVTPSSVTDAIASTTEPDLTVKDTPESSTRVSAITGLISRESGAAGEGASLTGFATVLDDPTQLTGPSRNQLLSLLGVNWLSAQNNWPAAVSASLTASGKILDSVQIVPPGNISQLSNEALIPITVSNAFTLPVNIVLRTTPSNARLEIDNDTSKTVPPGGSAKLLVPVKAQVGNGKVQLTMGLFSPTGVQVGATQTASVDVHADWEGLGALVIGILAVLLFGFGIFRTIRRRRKERANPAVEAAGDEDPNG